MKNQIIKFFVLLSFLLLIAQVRTTLASHAAGAQITYTCLGSNRYEVTMTFYRDCYGITPNTYMDIQISNDCSYPNQTVFLNQLGLEVDVETVCPTAITTCYGGSYSGIQKWTYRGIITLPGECAAWKIGHGEPARNSSLSTITGGGSDLQYVYCLINNTTGICNNSPTFNEDPIISYCVGQGIFIDPAVTDAERDSLVFEFIVPRTGPTEADTVTYLSGYSHSQFFLYNNPPSFEPATGIFQGIPSQTDNSVYAIRINEFRNGVLIGQVERDVMIAAENCSNIVPFLTGFNGTSNFTIDVYANQLNCLYVVPIDPNGSNQTVTYNNSIPGMAFYSSGSNPDTVTFCWTPTAADTLNNPYYMRLRASDENCPIPGFSARNYYINVRMPVGIDDLNESNFSLWPNPFQSEISFSSDVSGKVELMLYDLQGRQVMNTILTESNETIKLNSLENGIYMLSIRSVNSGKTSWKRVVKN